MKNITYYSKRIEKVVTDNSPAIMTALAVTGVVATTYLTAKATFKAGTILHNENVSRTSEGVPLTTRKDEFQLLWKLYIPAATTLTLTVTSIICANRIGTRRTAAMAAAYSLSEKAFGEYKEKVIEKIGKNKETAVRDEIAQDRINKNPVSANSVIIAGAGETLCYDTYTGRYFVSDMESLKKAQNDTNHEILNHGYSSLTDFYSRAGLSRTKTSDDVGWNSDKLLELTFSTTMSDDGRPCLAMDFDVVPVRNFFRTH